MTKRIPIAGATALVAFAALMLAGCGGGGGGTTPTPTPTTGTVRLNLTWPTREVPRAAESVQAVLERTGGTVIATSVLNRGTGGAATVTMPNVPVGTHTLRIRAFRQAAAAGQLIGEGSASVTVTAGGTTPISLNTNVAATVAEVRLNAPTVIFGGTTQLTPEFRDADGNVLAPADTAVTWAASAGSISDEGVYTAGSTAGAVTVTATHTDSGTEGEGTVTVVSNIALDEEFKSQAAGYQPPAHWSNRTRVWTLSPGDPQFLDPVDQPSARGLLGLFGAQTVSLNLADLPPHSGVRLEFDAAFVRYWKGDLEGGFRLTATINGTGQVFLNRSFSNYPYDPATPNQLYPGPHTQSFPTAGSEPFAGALQSKTLGYPAGFQGEISIDSVYRFANGTTGYTSDFSHTADTLRIDFTGVIPSGDAQWGLERVKVTLLP